MIEPLYEKLPDRVDQVDTRLQNLEIFGKMPFFRHIILYNFLHLKSQWFENYEPICEEKRRNFYCELPYIMFQRMAKSPNYFVLVEKEYYDKYLLPMQKEVDDGILSSVRGTDGSWAWEWRLSTKVSQTVLKAAIFPKYEWQLAERLNNFFYKLTVNEKIRDTSGTSVY